MIYKGSITPARAEIMLQILFKQVKRTFRNYEKILFEVWASSETDVYAVVEDWTILHYDGVLWSDVDTGI